MYVVYYIFAHWDRRLFHFNVCIIPQSYLQLHRAQFIFRLLQLVTANLIINIQLFFLSRPTPVFTAGLWNDAVLELKTNRYCTIKTNFRDVGLAYNTHRHIIRTLNHLRHNIEIYTGYSQRCVTCGRVIITRVLSKYVFYCITITTLYFITLFSRSEPRIILV